MTERPRQVIFGGVSSLSRPRIADQVNDTHTRGGRRQELHVVYDLPAYCR